MDESNANNQEHKPDQQLSGPELEFERLMTRIVDDEASRDDWRQFDRLADRDPLIWRRLSLRQGDMLRLGAKIDRQMHAFEQVDLPNAATAPSRNAPSIRARLPMLSAVVGWAAVFVMAVVWGTTSLRDRDRIESSGLVPASQSAERMTPDEHLHEYMKAPWVLGEMPPTLLQVDEMSDGRKALRILRRIEEVTFLDPEEPLPVKEDGSINKPLSEMHDDSKAARTRLND
jgi:hypothetical protein